jgi:hypothetical protein
MNFVAVTRKAAVFCENFPYSVEEVSFSVVMKMVIITSEV